VVTLTGIRRVMKKLEAQSSDALAKKARVAEVTGRGGETRFSLYYDSQLVFTFGITRSPRRRSKQFHYVPRQMHLQHREYSELHDCPMSKEDYVRLLLQRGRISHSARRGE
jgi:hypothetical protein